MAKEYIRDQKYMVDGKATDYKVFRDTETGKKTFEVIAAKEGSLGAGYGKRNRTELLKRRQEKSAKEAADASKEAEYQRTLNMRGDQSQKRAQEARDMPLLDRTMIRAGRETDKLMTGIDEMKDFLTYSVPGFEMLTSPQSAIPGLFSEKDYQERALERTGKRSKDQASKDEVYKELGENIGMGEMGSMLPYLLTGMGLDKVLKKGVGKAFTGIEQKTKAAASDTGSFLSKLILSQKDKPGKGGDFVRQIDDEIIQPIKDQSMHLKNRPADIDPYRKHPGQDFTVAGLTGAIESGVHYDESIGQGAASSLLGTVLGKTRGMRGLERMPNVNDPYVNTLLKEFKKKGFVALPGIQKGHRDIQKYEQNLRTDDRYSNSFHQVDVGNQKVINDTALKTAGFPQEGLKHIPPERMAAHVDSLKKEFDELEAKSVGRFDYAEINQVKTDWDSLDLDQQKRLRKPYEDFLKIKQNMGRDPSGRMTKATFNGKTYKDTYSKLKVAKDSAFAQGRMDEVDQINGLIKTLEVGMNRGMKEYGGEATQQAWKTAREKYAMSKLLMNHGMDSMGTIDMTKLTSHLEGKDMERMLLGQGNRITDLHKIVKMNNIQNGTARSGLQHEVDADSGAAILGGETGRKKLGLQMSSATPMMSLSEKAKAWGYKRGYPTSKGYLGLPNDNPMDAAHLLRASEQGSDRHTSPKKILEEIVGLGRMGHDATQWAGKKIGGKLYDEFGETEEEMLERLRDEMRAKLK